MPRRIYWFAVFAAVAAGTYMAYRFGLRSVERTSRANGAARGRLRWAEDPNAWQARASGGGREPRMTEAEPDEAPTGDVATVVATMDAPSPAPTARHYDGNGSPKIVQLPAEAAGGPALAAPVRLPERRGLSGTTLAAIATAVGVAAIGLGAWAVALSLDDDGGNGAATTAIELQGVQQVVSLLSKPSTERIPLQGSSGRIILVVGARGYGVLVLDGLSPAPAGKSYQAWVIRPNADAPQSAAVFSAEDVVVPLTTRVPPGAAVAITLERAGGVPAPTQTPKLVAERTS